MRSNNYEHDLWLNCCRSSTVSRYTVNPANIKRMKPFEMKLDVYMMFKAILL